LVVFLAAFLVVFLAAVFFFAFFLAIIFSEIDLDLYLPKNIFIKNILLHLILGRKKTNATVEN